MKVIDLTKESFTERVSDFRQYPDGWEFKGDKPCIVDFQAPWCGYCKRLDPILAEFAQTYEGQLYIYKVNVDNEEELETAFNIRTIPTLLLCKMDGTKELMLGTLPKHELKKVIENLISVQ